MENIGKLFEYIMLGMKHEFNIYGWNVSMWQIYVFVITTSIVCLIVGGVLNHE